MTQLAQQRNLVVYKVVKTKVKVKIPILLNGKVLHRVEKLTATWIDPETGELLTEKQASAEGYPSFDHGTMFLQKEYILSLLRTPSRNFAYFLLKFRNKRGGLTPDIDTLCEWYSKLNKERLDNVKLFIKSLQKAGVIDIGDKNLLTPLFQIVDKKARKSQYKGEMFIAKTKFVLMMLEKQPITRRKPSRREEDSLG